MDESINKLIFLSNCIYSIDFSEPSQKEEFDKVKIFITKIQDFQSIDDQTIARIKNQVE